MSIFNRSLRFGQNHTSLKVIWKAQSKPGNKLAVNYSRVIDVDDLRLNGRSVLNLKAIDADTDADTDIESSQMVV